MRWELIQHDAFLEAKTFGKASVAGFRDFMNAVIVCPTWHPGMPLLIDHRGLDDLDSMSANIREVSWLYAEREDTLGRSRTAFVMRDTLAYGIGRMWEGITENKAQRDTMIFMSKDEAIQWLLEPPPPPEDINR